MARIGELSSQVYIEGVAKTNIEPMNADQQKTNKETRYLWETLTDPQVKSGPVIPSNS